jgi:hypothetical protein
MSPLTDRLADIRYVCAVCAGRPSRRAFFFGSYFLCRCADVAFSVALSAWMRPSSAASFVS